MRQIFLLILLFIVGQWLVKALRRADANQSNRTGASGGAAAGEGAQGARQGTGAQRGAAQPPRLAEPMIRCVACGVHAPASDSVVVAGQPFCCAAHAQRHAAPPTGRDAR